MYLSARSPASVNHQFENAFKPTRLLVALLLIDRELRLLLNNEIHRALSFFVGHWLIPLISRTVLLSSNNVDQHIKFAVRVRNRILSAFLGFRKFLLRFGKFHKGRCQTLVGAAPSVPLATAGPDH